jgi:two-component system sensor histidine kinase KdpD
MGEGIMLQQLGNQKSTKTQVLITISLMICTILIGLTLTALSVPEETVILIYVLCIVLVATLTDSYIYGFVTAICCTLAYNFFVITPVFAFRFRVATILIFLFMVTISLFISFLTSNVHQRELIAQERERETGILYSISRRLSGAHTVLEVVQMTLEFISSSFDTSCKLLLFDEDREPERFYTLMENGQIQKHVPTDETRDFLEYKSKPQNGYYMNAKQYEWPIYGKDNDLVGALAVPVDKAAHLLPYDLKIISAVAEIAGLSITNLKLIQRQEQTRQEIKQERFRSNLLRSISHDIRTPLAAISGMAEVLMSRLDEKSEEYQLAKDIHKETGWLYDFVHNILSLTRLQSGRVNLDKKLEVIEDVVNASIDAMKVRMPQKEIIKDFSPEVLTARMDSSLIKQVILNLLDNANKYAPADTPVTVRIAEDESKENVEISVMDEGPGIKQEVLERIFEVFYTTNANAPDALKGFGLGLPICDSIMKAHNGTIKAGNRKDRTGAVFTISLPQEKLDLYNA